MVLDLPVLSWNLLTLSCDLTWDWLVFTSNLTVWTWDLIWDLLRIYSGIDLRLSFRDLEHFGLHLELDLTFACPDFGLGGRDLWLNWDLPVLRWDLLDLWLDSGLSFGISLFDLVRWVVQGWTLDLPFDVGLGLESGLLFLVVGFTFSSFGTWYLLVLTLDLVVLTYD